MSAFKMRLDFAPNLITKRMALYGINFWLFGHLFTFQIRSYQTDRLWFRFHHKKV